MSLRFDCTKIADKPFLNRMGSADPGHMEDPTKEYWSYEITAIAHWSMVVDLGEITEANVEKWYGRYVMFMLATNAPKDEWYITLPMLRRAIGFSVNVFTATDAAYAKWIRSKIEETTKRLVSDARQAL